MQNAAFKACDIDAGYELFDVAPENLEKFLDDTAKGRNAISGLNVTIPHKIKAKEYLELNGKLDEVARRLGAVNTIKVEDGGLRGFNTDGPGFYRSLLEDLRFEPEGKRVFVLGAGGAARAVIMYLGNGPEKICVYDVDKEKTSELKKHYGKYYDEKKLVITSGSLKEALSDCALVINTTPIGMKESDPSPIDKNFFRPGTRVYDLIYNRPVTQLVREANSMKLHAVTGIGMLLHQGVIAFEIWTGKKAPVSVMKKALKDALK
jgi:shikimate dehydrogenase